MVDTISIQAEALHSTTLLKVIRPDKGNINKVMLLLHGHMEPELSTEILKYMPEELELEELCNQYGIMVVIPLMQNRYYISTKDYNCGLFVAQELPEVIIENYGIAEGKEWILAGISMGGFGATLIGAQTGVFRQIISISGAFIAHDVAIGNPQVWGNLLPNSMNLYTSFLYHFLPLEDLEQSVERNALAALELLQKDRTIIVATCGTSDMLYTRNLEFKRAMDKYKVNYQFYPLENGEHEPECFKAGLWKAVEYLCRKE